MISMETKSDNLISLQSNEEKAQVSPSKHIQPSVMSAEVTPETVRLPATFAVKVQRGRVVEDGHQLMLNVFLLV